MYAKVILKIQPQPILLNFIQDKDNNSIKYNLYSQLTTG